jgi:Mlc titration factor MtfA (ptsG expression regulator)
MPLTTRKLHGLAKRKLAELKVSINPESIEVEDILTKNLPFFNGLDQNHKKVFLRKVLVFLNSKNFIAMNNFEINLIHCTIISALAVRLAFILGLKYYDHIINIYLFDSEF